MNKKILSIFFMLIFLFSFSFSLPVFAASSYPSNLYQVGAMASGEQVAVGRDGNLYIYRSSAVYNSITAQSVYWSEYKNGTLLDSGVNSIGVYSSNLDQWHTCTPNLTLSPTDTYEIVEKSSSGSILFGPAYVGPGYDIYQSAYTVPTIPTGLSVSGSGGSGTLSWNANPSSDYVTSYNIYENGSKIGSSVSTSYAISGLSAGTYNFTVTAVNAVGESGQSSSVSYVVLAAPELTAKAGNAQVDLSWTAVTGATGYNIKTATVAGGPYTTVASNVSTTTYSAINLTNGTTFYFVISAVNSNSESANSNEASATPVNSGNSGKALLRIKLVNGLELEYDTTTSEADAFAAWYNARSNGTGPATYEISKTGNLGPFKNRNDYIIFDKIVDWEVMEY